MWQRRSLPRTSETWSVEPAVPHRWSGEEPVLGRAARRQEPEVNGGKKLKVVRAAARHSFPTADVDQMLAEIEQGYQSDSSQ